MKINLLPNKKAVWNSTYKTFHIVALVALVFNMSSIGVFLTPNTALAKEKVPEPTVVAEKVKEKAPEPTKVVEETTDKDSCETGAKCEDTGNLRIKKYHELDAIGTPGYGSKTGSDYYMTGWYFEVTQGSVSVGNGWTGEDGDFLIIEDLPVGDYQVTETQQPGWVNSDPGVNPITKTVTVVDEDTTTYSNVWFGNTEIPGVCDLEIVKSVKNLTQSIPGNPHVSAEPGNTLEYTLTYENIGDADCTGGGVQLFDNLDSRLTFNGAHTEDNDDHDITYQGNYNGTDPVANAHVVSPGESGYVIFQAVVTDDLECGETIIPNKYRIWSTENGSQDSNIVNVNVYKECFGSLKVIKTVDFGEATPDMWEFTVPGYGTQSPAQGQDYVTFSLLPEGTYSATESNFPGYHQ
ncbi:hypothetical protein KJ705_00965, partial [Patescibacteria group bacterium]|nr:hypothetical protein [Patescibacteria group bacterium]